MRLIDFKDLQNSNLEKHSELYKHFDGGNYCDNIT